MFGKWRKIAKKRAKKLSPVQVINPIGLRKLSGQFCLSRSLSSKTNGWFGQTYSNFNSKSISLSRQFWFFFESGQFNVQNCVNLCIFSRCVQNADRIQWCPFMMRVVSKVSPQRRTRPAASPPENSEGASPTISNENLRARPTEYKTLFIYLNTTADLASQTAIFLKVQ